MQMAWSVPALTVGAVVMVMIIASVTARQLPLPVVVRVRVTDPLVLSAVEGT